MASAADLSVRQFFSRSKVVETDKKNTTGSSNGNTEQEQQQEQQQQQEEQHQQHRRRRLCKTFVKMDRGLRAEEAGNVTRLMLLTPRECMPKNDLLCVVGIYIGMGQQRVHCNAQLEDYKPSKTNKQGMLSKYVLPIFYFFVFLQFLSFFFPSLA
jgi:hypothetical protein